MKGFTAWLSEMVADGGFVALAPYIDHDSWPGDVAGGDLMSWLGRYDAPARALVKLHHALDAFARQQGLNIDGTARRETVAAAGLTPARGSVDWLSALDAMIESLGADLSGQVPRDPAAKAMDDILAFAAGSSDASPTAIVLAGTGNDKSSHDPVHNPAHYHGAGGLESIVIAEAFDLNRYRANVLKYLLRAGQRNDDSVETETEDLEKARQFLSREINLRKTGKASWS